jgi:GNAT superfamily N-acetyltransferase
MHPFIFHIRKRSLQVGHLGGPTLKVKIQSFMEIMQLREKHRPENFARFVSPSRAEILVEAVSNRIDPRIQDEVGFFAISKGNKVLGQAGVSFPRLTSTAGTFEVGHGGGAICLYVDFQHRRRGIGAQLRQRQMEYFRERGMEFSSSINAEIFEGIQDIQDRKFGYIPVLNYPNYYKVSGGGKDTPSDTEFSRETGDPIALWKVYSALKEDCLGFIERPKNFINIGRLDGLLANAPFYQDKFLIGKRGSRSVSFANVKQGSADFQGQVIVNETHATSEEELNVIVNHIEKENPGKVILFSPVVDHHLKKVLTQRNYQHYLTGGFLMMTSLTGTTDKEKLNDLFHFNERFEWNVYEDI